MQAVAEECPAQGSDFRHRHVEEQGEAPEEAARSECPAKEEQGRHPSPVQNSTLRFPSAPDLGLRGQDLPDGFWQVGPLSPFGQSIVAPSIAANTNDKRGLKRCTGQARQEHD